MPRGLMLAGLALCVFAIVIVVMLNVMPQPLKSSDYLVIGSVATLSAMAVLFVLLISTTKSRDVFFKRRPRK
jgi:hypothetical protein